MNSVQSPHQYPQAIQLKLYQAFIFSIPILFSIILFLLFYLFYLKRRANSTITNSPILPRSTINDSSIRRPSDLDLKTELKNKMNAVLFDDYMKARDSLCCVCLGEFEMKEELVQVPLCKHIFHIDCISYWLHNNSTCPLCRAPVASPGPFQVQLSIPPANSTPEIIISEFESNHHQLHYIGSTSSGGGSTSSC